MDDTSQHEVEARLLEAPTLRDYLDDYALRAGRHLGSGTEISISLRHAGSDRLAASGSPRAARCDEVEYRVDAGPCILAMDSMRVVMVPDLAQDERWPEWREVALAQGFRSSAGVPAHVADGVEIAVNLYSETVDAWDRAEILRADTYAQQIATSVGLALQVAQLTTTRSDADGALRELETVNRLVVGALVTDDDAAAVLLQRIRQVVANGSADAQGQVRRLVREVGSGAGSPARTADGD